MLFNSLEFVLFFFIVWLLYYLLRRTLRIQNILLLIASYTFYSFWDWRFLSLVLLSTIVDYFCGLKLGDPNTKNRKLFLIISVVFNLGILAIFKYAGFFITEFVNLLALFGVQANEPSLNIILPLGISFYTFQTMAYTIDVYRRKIPHEKDILNLALYVSFFPQLVAGPIERAQNLLPQIKNQRNVTVTDILEGGWLIYFGYFLKVFVADNLAKIVNSIFALEEVRFFETVTGAYAFAFQIYGDFAGYTFIAIGVARLLGFRLMTNFLFPYFVTNAQDFWRNWHISLSTWLKDYLYIPLGGNRFGKWMTFRNLMLTMLLGGLWHGAAWNFVIWGFYHGLLLILFRMALGKNEITTKWKKYLAIIFMFQLTCIGWLIFRVENMDQLGMMLQSLVEFEAWSSSELNNIKRVIFYSTLPILITFYQYKTNSGNMLDKMPNALRVLLYVIMFYAIFALGEFGKQEFIYFQF